MNQELAAKNWRELKRPRELETDGSAATETYGRFSCEPLERGFGLFAEEGYRSDTVTCVDRGDGPDFVPALDKLMEEGIYVSNGYGKLKDLTFRIGHMGEHTLDTINGMLERFDAALQVTAGGVS